MPFLPFQAYYLKAIAGREEGHVFVLVYEYCAFLQMMKQHEVTELDKVEIQRVTHMIVTGSPAAVAWATNCQPRLA